MFKNPWVTLAIGVIAGYMLSDRLALIPGVNKLPKL